MAETVLSSEFQTIGNDLASDRESGFDSRPDDCLFLTQRLLGGDREAFREYYDEYFDFMLAESKRCSGCDEQTCLDIVHDAMLKAIRGMKAIDNRRKLRAWTRLIVKSVAYDWLRRESRRRQSLKDSVGDALTRSTSGVPSTLSDEARLMWLEEQLSQMPTDLRKMFRWRFRLGWTLRRIGSRMGLKPGAVDGRLRRAIEELRSLAEEQSDE